MSVPRFSYRLPAGLLLLILVAVAPSAIGATYPEPEEGDFQIQDFEFASGEVLPELKLHYTTIGQPKRDASGSVRNAVLIMHGTRSTPTG